MRGLGLSGVVYDVETNRVAHIDFYTPVWSDICEWAKFHGIDVMRVPGGSVMIRDGANRCIRYTKFVCDDQNDPIVGPAGFVTAEMVEQNEAIAPLPESVRAISVDAGRQADWTLARPPFSAPRHG